MGRLFLARDIEMARTALRVFARIMNNYRESIRIALVTHFSRIVPLNPCLLDHSLGREFCEWIADRIANGEVDPFSRG